MQRGEQQEQHRCHGGSQRATTTLTAF
jgi:hypothetical protein